MHEPATSVRKISSIFPTIRMTFYDTYSSLNSVEYRMEKTIENRPADVCSNRASPKYVAYIKKAIMSRRNSEPRIGGQKN